jgi:hypothetical protein
VTTRPDHLAGLVNGGTGLDLLSRADTLVQDVPAEPTPPKNPYACWTTQDLVDFLVGHGGLPVPAYVEYGRRVERGDITGDGRIMADADSGGE